MEYVYAAMVLHAAGKKITDDAIASVLKAAGVEPDMGRVKALTSALEGVDIEKAIATAAFAAAPAATSAPAGPAPEKKEAKKEEKKEEEKGVPEEEAAGGLSALFG
ncbi:MAG: 50S ribosomal protein P1 [Thermoplasmata archaeon]